MGKATIIPLQAVKMSDMKANSLSRPNNNPAH
jgi:hypothetical protein